MSFVKETEEIHSIGEVTKTEESVGGEKVFGDGDNTGSGMSAGDTATTAKPSQEILSKSVDEWLQVLYKEEMASVKMLLCFHLVSMLSLTETKAADCATTMMYKSEQTVRQWRNAIFRNNRDSYAESKH